MRRQEGRRILVDRLYQYNQGRDNCENVTSKGYNATYWALPIRHSADTEYKRVTT